MNNIPVDPGKVQYIMQASMKLFSERGFSRTKTEDIAAIAGWSHLLLELPPDRACLRQEPVIMADSDQHPCE